MHEEIISAALARPKFAERFWAKVQRSDGCWNWRGKSAKDGYGCVVFNYRAENHRRNIMRAAHRIAWILRRGPIADGLFVLHSCDNRLCCNLAHLRLGTHADNMRDMAERGRSANTKLDPAQREIAAIMRGLGYRNGEVAALFGVRPQTISMIMARKRIVA
jgi:DNA-binding CsgD family transcriptional regulator